jgi:Icc-related predicted phosphoesterase
MKLIATSDLHGTLPEIKEKCDAVIVAGDIIPLDIQRDLVRSVVWFSTEFVNWCMKLDCEKVFVVAGNHDFFIEYIINDSVKNMECSKLYADAYGDVIINMKLMLPDKIAFLHDSKYVFHDKVFYGTPWCPTLKNWAFYKSDEDLAEAFKKLPQDIDVLITHAPGYKINQTGISLEYGYTQDYGSSELTKAVLKRNVKYWVCGHVHSGNHELSNYQDTDMKVANVSYKDESYKPAFRPLIFEI